MGIHYSIKSSFIYINQILDAQKCLIEPFDYEILVHCICLVQYAQNLPSNIPNQASWFKQMGVRGLYGVYTFIYLQILHATCP